MSSAAARKLKVSITLPADVVALVDRDAALLGSTRSGIIEQWLRRAASSAAEQAIDAATAAYYLSVGPDERAENEDLAKASSRGARRVSYDGGPRPRRQGAHD